MTDQLDSVLKRLIEFQVIALRKPVAQELMKHKDIAQFVKNLHENYGIAIGGDEGNVGIVEMEDSNELPNK